MNESWRGDGRPWDRICGLALIAALWPWFFYLIIRDDLKLAVPVRHP